MSNTKYLTLKCGPGRVQHHLDQDYRDVARVSITNYSVVGGSETAPLNIHFNWVNVPFTYDENSGNRSGIPLLKADTRFGGDAVIMDSFEGGEVHIPRQFWSELKTFAGAITTVEVAYVTLKIEVKAINRARIMPNFQRADVGKADVDHGGVEHIATREVETDKQPATYEQRNPEFTGGINKGMGMSHVGSNVVASSSMTSVRKR